MLEEMEVMRALRLDSYYRHPHAARVAAKAITVARGHTPDLSRRLETRRGRGYTARPAIPLAAVIFEMNRMQHTVIVLVLVVVTDAP